MSAVTMYGYDIAAPLSAPVPTQGSASGSMASGSYRYEITYVTAFGETDSTVVSALTASTSGSMNLVLPLCPDANCTSRKIYRTVVGGAGLYYLVATVADNTTTTYTDILIDASLGAAAPSTNTASSIETIKGHVSFTKPVMNPFVTGLVATGATIADALPVSSEFNIVITTAAGTGVILPDAITGMHIRVINQGANALLVYPIATEQINAGGAGVAVSLATLSCLDLIATSSTAWTTVGRFLYV